MEEDDGSWSVDTFRHAFGDDLLGNPEHWEERPMPFLNLRMTCGMVRREWGANYVKAALFQGWVLASRSSVTSI
jgi:hypothetical protein